MFTFVLTGFCDKMVIPTLDEGSHIMARIQKPEPDLVRKAAQALKNPKTASLKTVQRLAALALDDQEYDPKPHRPKPKSPSR